MSETDLETLVPAGPARALTAAKFRGLATVPPELEWFANIPNARTRRAYQQDLRDFRLPGGTTRGTLSGRQTDLSGGVLTVLRRADFVRPRRNT